MVFSSSIFLFFFLPLVLLIYYALLRGRRARNLFLTIMSLLFYAWGEPWFVFVMIFSIFMNWIGGRMIDRYKDDPRRKKAALVCFVTFDVALLAVFKYLMFLMNNVNWAFGLHLPVPQIVLPIGISFFTFQAISYIVDVYRGKGRVQHDFFNLCLYISFFPQLIAGPIVRYQTVADQIDGRVENMDDFARGCQRFTVGLCKKVLLANNLALLCDSGYALGAGELSTATAWLAAFAYHWQVYFDFSGYSDMAIGLGWMFGFHFLENFDYPMLSRSITEFWRRWHISLSSWFRDYVFFPLGGSRVKHKSRLLFNMFVVWALTGLWHGADWSFLFWGLSFFVLLVVERYTPLQKWMTARPLLGMLYTSVAVIAVTVMIRSTNLQQAGSVLSAMFGFAPKGLWDDTAVMLLREYGLFALLGIIAALPVGQWLQRALRIPDGVMRVIEGVFLCAALFVALTYIVMGGYNPFIYFNF